MSSKKEILLASIINTVYEILEQYSSDNVDVVRDEETNMLNIIYHSRHNSFPIETNVAKFDDVDIEELEKELDNCNVGHCW